MNAGLRSSEHIVDMTAVDAFHPLAIPGLRGGSATITVDIVRVLDLYIGEVTVSDPRGPLPTLTQGLSQAGVGVGEKLPYAIGQLANLFAGQGLRPTELVSFIIAPPATIWRAVGVQLGQRRK